MTPFHAALAAYRQRSGLSVQALAERAAIRSTGHTHRLLTGHARPSRDVVIRLALALALDVAQTDALLRAAGHAEPPSDRADRFVAEVVALAASVPRARRADVLAALRGLADSGPLYTGGGQRKRRKA